MLNPVARTGGTLFAEALARLSPSVRFIHSNLAVPMPVRPAQMPASLKPLFTPPSSLQSVRFQHDTRGPNVTSSVPEPTQRLGRAMERLRVTQAESFVAAALPLMQAHEPLDRLDADAKEGMVQSLVSAAAQALGLQRSDYTVAYLDQPEPFGRGSVAYVEDTIEAPELLVFEPATRFGALQFLGTMAQESLHLSQGELALVAEEDDAMLDTRHAPGVDAEHGPSISPALKSLGAAFSAALRNAHDPGAPSNPPLAYPLYQHHERDAWGFQVAVKIVACHDPAFRSDTGVAGVYGDVSLSQLRQDGSQRALAALAERRGGFSLAELAARVGVRAPQPASGSASSPGQGPGIDDEFKALKNYLDGKLGPLRDEASSTLRREMQLQMLHALGDVVRAAQDARHPAQRAARELVNAVSDAVGLPLPYPGTGTAKATA